MAVVALAVTVVSAVAPVASQKVEVSVVASEDPAVSAEEGEREVLEEHIVVVAAEAPVALADQVEMVDTTT